MLEDQFNYPRYYYYCYYLVGSYWLEDNVGNYFRITEHWLIGTKMRVCECLIYVVKFFSRIPQYITVITDFLWFRVRILFITFFFKFVRFVCFPYSLLLTCCGALNILPEYPAHMITSNFASKPDVV